MTRLFTGPWPGRWTGTDHGLCADGIGLIFLLAVVAFAIGCANMASPPGGPADRTPPTIVATFPPGDSLRVNRNVTVSITFSERVDHRSVKDALFIAPNPGEDLRLKWKGKGKRLVIRFVKPLRPEQTYVITIGAGVRDLRGNSMQESFTLAFSTGDHLDQGVISGRVYGAAQPEGVSVWGYFLVCPTRKEQEPDPQKMPPDYITQCDVNGGFQLNNLTPKSYRIFAVIDRDKNLLYTPGYDAIGVSSADVFLSQNNLQSRKRLFRVAVQDTTGLSLLGVSALDRRHLDLRCNKAAEAADVIIDNFTLYSDSLQQNLPIQQVYVNRQNPAYIHFLVDLPHSGKYQLLVHRLRDQFGNFLPTDEATIEFACPGAQEGKANQDTLRPRLLSFHPPDSSRNVLPREPLELVFSEAMDSISVQAHFWVLDSTGTRISGDFEWCNPAVVQFRPRAAPGPWPGRRAGWVSRMAYEAHLQVDSVYDISGNCLADSLLHRHFWTVNHDTLSSISGVVQDEDSTATGKVFLTAIQVEGGNATATVELDLVGPYEFSNLLPGVYVIEGFRDIDGNGRYSLGQPYPFVPSERFTVYPDSIAVRARWPNEGNDVILGK